MLVLGMLVVVVVVVVVLWISRVVFTRIGSGSVL